MEIRWADGEPWYSVKGHPELNSSFGDIQRGQAHPGSGEGQDGAFIIPYQCLFVDGAFRAPGETFMVRYEGRLFHVYRDHNDSGWKYENHSGILVRIRVVELGEDEA